MTLKRRQFLAGTLVARAGTVNSPPEQGVAPSGRQKFRILSLDGGGARGYLSAGIHFSMSISCSKR